MIAVVLSSSSMGYLWQRAVFMDFCKHDSCTCGVNARYGHLKLVVPMSNLLGHCKAMWTKMLLHQDMDYEVMGSNNLHNSLSCRERSYALSTRRIVRGEQINVILLGCLKISASGRLQLVDATGSIDVSISDLPSTWHYKWVIEVKDFNIIMEGLGRKPDYLEPHMYESFTCQNIFSGTPSLREMDMSLYLKFNVKDQQLMNCPCPFCINWKGNSQVLESGKFYVLQLMHKFPVLQKFQGDRVTSDQLSAFAEAVVLPWELLVSHENRDAHPDMLSSDQLRDMHLKLISSDQHITRIENGDCVILKRCKIDQSSSQDTTAGWNDAKNRCYGLSSDSVTTHYSSHVTCNCCDSNCSFEIPCKITRRNGDYDSMGVLKCRDPNAKSSSTQCMTKILLEFNSESFFQYQALRIGSYYIMEHREEDIICPIANHCDASVSKLLITSEIHFWSTSFSCTEAPQDSNSLSVSKSCHSHVDNNEDLNRLEIYSEINICIPPSFVNYLKFGSKVLDGLLGPSLTLKEEVASHNTKEAMISSSLRSSEMTYPNQLLPEGNLTSLRGLVTAVHDCDRSHIATQEKARRPGAILQPVLSQGTNSICIHIVTNNLNVKIVGCSYKGSYPAGFGKGINATFHRILELGGQNEYMLIPASLIVIDSSSPLNEPFADDNDYAPPALGSESVTYPKAVPTILISEILHMESKPLQLHCRVLTVYVLVLEKTRRATSCQSESSTIDIILAGFVLDDGASSCCCWANHERAAALLRLHVEEFPHEAYSRNLSNKSRVKQACGSTIGRLNRILRKHGRVIVKNNGSSYDSLCQDLTFSVSSDKVISSTDDNVLRRLIFNACFSTLWTVVGSLMDCSAMNRLEQYLGELEIAMLPLQNIWATGVHHMNPLTEARNIFQDLVSR